MSWEPRTLAAVLAEQVSQRGVQRALVTPDGSTMWRQLELQARRVARALLARGIKHGDFVGLLCGNDDRWVASFYGAAMIGAVTVPVNTRFKAAEIAYCLRQSDVRLLILADRFLKIDFMGYLREAEPAVDHALPGTELPLLDHVVAIGDDVPRAGLGWDAFLASGEEISDDALDAAMQAVVPDDLLLIQFTSGTTAHPKGVMLTHDNMLRNATAVGQRLGIDATDCYFNCRPFFHVAGSTLSLLCALCAGASIATLPTFEAGAALRMLDQERCTFISGNETLFQLLIAHENFDRTRLHLRGGWAAAGPDTMRRIIDEMGIGRICWAYGLSEASPNVVLNDWRDDEALRVGGFALPHDGVEVRIVDDTTGKVCASGEVGEIQVKGWGVMRGYYKQPEANAKVFTADGWLRTGDLGALRADGRLRLVGRLKDVFRVGGENVAPAEVEQVLLSHPAVASAQVVGVPDARLGEVPAAFVTLKPGMTLDAEALLAWSKPRMANFRTPRYADVVTDFERIGMTASGKVQKNKLREHAIALFGLAN
ncbi:AMP-binding protein [Cupriavidus pampae]|uniref:3-[(3aS,4S,7aS)-7a-methyl-1, 5-dioxo-octahydro-1H-inden-4-yl]propanoyl:CoA ligase n=1 Tax=Cupriavidus pampae TaxID=659251 RepID=A0ABN7XZ01_9BURK|nr:AMP-binding protein [Cupriavidus pampae]CAG9166324.1 3-[(3aS,4S,7aS)-7a-methyl-1, 5-dioxo-octahydro-1H-inden-4-yl]propanoyl:CoA ligase [Cupriavidus pampae]